MNKRFKLFIFSLFSFSVSFGQVNDKGSITSFNPYVSQIPSVLKAPPLNYNAYQNNNRQFEIGRDRIQTALDNLYGSEILNEGGKVYFKKRMDELITVLNKYSNADLSIRNNVDQLLGLFNPIYEDQNISTDIANSKIFRQWERLALLYLNKGKMEPFEYEYELGEAKKWMSSMTAGIEYSGYKYPNTNMKVDVDQKINSFLVSCRRFDKKTNKKYFIIEGERFDMKNGNDSTNILFTIVKKYLTTDESDIFYHFLIMSDKKN